MFKLIFLNLLMNKKKKYKNYFILFSISIIAMMFVILSLISLNSEIIELKHNIDNRQFQIQKLEGCKFDINMINNNKHIVDYYIEYDKLYFENANHKFNVKYSYFEEYESNIIIGRRLKTDEKDSVVLPSKILINNDFVYFKDLYGKKISFDIYVDDIFITKYTPKVVGIYKTNSPNASIIISKNNFKNLINISENEADKLNIVVDNYDNLEKVSDVLSSFSDVYFNTTLNFETLENKINLFKVLKLISLFINIVMLVFFVTIVNNIKYDLKKDLDLLRVLGYSSFTISFAVFKYIFLIYFISFLCSIILYLIFLLFVNLLRISIISLTFKSFLISLFLVFIIDIIIIIICTISFYIKIKHSNSIISNL